MQLSGWRAFCAEGSSVTSSCLEKGKDSSVAPGEGIRQGVEGGGGRSQC